MRYEFNVSKGSLIGPCRLLGVVLIALVAVGGGDPAGAQVIYRDPDTGQLGTPPPGAGNAGSGGSGTGAQPDEALVAEPIPGPSGGVMIDLRRRYGAAVTMEAGAGGTGQVRCGGGGEAAR